jgi:hypothetical protein
VSPSNSSITVTLALSEKGSVFCGAYTTSDRPQAVASVMLLNHFAQISDPLVSQRILLTSLEASTSYEVYCVTRNSFGSVMSLEMMLQGRVLTKTLCCKRVSVSLSIASFLEGRVNSKVVSVVANGSPSPLSEVSLELKALFEPVGVVGSGESRVISGPDIFYPSTIVLNLKTWSTPQLVSILSSSPGRYTIMASIVVSNPGDESPYDQILFGESATGSVFTIFALNVEPPTPKMKMATFSSSGLIVLVTFDSPTNTGAIPLSKSFKCSDVFIFRGCDSASCVWTTSSTVTMTPGGADRVFPGDRISVLSGLLRAECSTQANSISPSNCSKWKSVSSTESVEISRPVQLDVPVVMIRSPSVVNPCDSVILDLTSSTGSGGRDWRSSEIVVSGADAESVSLLNDFFNTSFHINPPTPVPRGLLRVGSIYDFEVTLCNFLDSCGVGFSRMEALDPGSPSVTIVGQQSRTLWSGSMLLLQSEASVRSCTGNSSSSSSVSMSWMVYQDGLFNASLTSVSRDRFKFKLNPYTLTPLSLYQVFVVATNPLNGISSRATVEITVPQSRLVALIRGGSTLSLRLGSSLVLDASTSYDPDVPSGAKRAESTKQLRFEWDCYQSLPSLSANCGLKFESLNNGMQVRASCLSSVSSSEVGSTYQVVVSVSDVNRVSRSQEISITLSEPSSAMVSVSSKSLKINGGDQLVLYGSVNSSYPVRSVWSEWEESTKMKMDVSSVSMMNSSCWLLSGLHSCNLVLRSNMLVGRSAPYVFMLSVSSTSSSSSSSTVSSAISITVNASPLPGYFQVTPPNGSALSTSFLLSASLWSDEDLPLSYEYRYLSEKGVGLVVRGRSESTFTNSRLPSGVSSKGFELTCQLRVFDSLNANEMTTSVVIVKSLEDSGLGIQAMAGQLSAQLAVASSGNVDDTKQMMSLGLSLLSAKDCSRLTVDCGSLNREECEQGSTPNSCGPCLSGFEELSGVDSNSVCLSKSDYLSSFSLLTSIGSRSCSSNADCIPWGSCDLSQKPSVCVLNSRECLNNCSGHGSCGYVGVGVGMGSGIKVTDCLLGDVSCEPVCECESGWDGSSCGMTSGDMLAKISLRTDLARNLVDLTLLDEPSQDSIESWESSLSSLSEDEDELSSDSAMMMASVASTILEYASSLDLDSSLLSGVLSSLDVSSSVMLSSGSSSSSSHSINSLANNHRTLHKLFRSSQPLSQSAIFTPSPYLSTVLNILDLYGGAMSSALVSGQDPISSLHSNFRSTIAELSEDNLVVTLPLSSHEEMSGDISPSVKLVSSVSSLSGMKISAFSVDSGLYESSESSVAYSSNPLRVVYSNGNFPPENVLVTLRSSQAESYKTIESPEVVIVNTTCEAGDYETYFLPCPNGVNISHRCQGASVVLMTRCPIMKKVPSCEVLSFRGVSPLNCTAESYTSTHINCRCNLTSPSSSSHSSPRVLSTTATEDSAVEGSGVLEVASVTVLVGEQFFETIETAGDLNSAADLKKTLIVILMYGTLWSVGLLGILSCSCFQRFRSSKSGAEVMLSEKKERAMLTRSNHDIKQYLMGYVNEVFPSVYQTKSGVERLWTEIKKHHRYLLLFSTSGDVSESRRMLTGVQLLTVQSMLMFILAVCYDLQVSLHLCCSLLLI